jgi:predicted nucleic acid-binding protein
MITYVDTSTLIKIIIDEDGSDAAATIWDTADELVSAHITFVEAVAAFAAAARGKRLDRERHRQARADLADLWEQFTICEVTGDVIRTAGDLAERHGLRGYDAVHLASALKVGATILTSSDQRLCEAAQICGLHVANTLRIDRA